MTISEALALPDYSGLSLVVGRVWVYVRPNEPRQCRTVTYGREEWDAPPELTVDVLAGEYDSLPPGAVAGIDYIDPALYDGAPVPF